MLELRNIKKAMGGLKLDRELNQEKKLPTIRRFSLF